MRPPFGKRLLATAIAGLALALPAVASAQEAAPAESHFGQRDSFVVSIERIFGFQGQKFGELNNDSIGFHPALWGNVGLFAMTQNGLNFGTTVGLSHTRDLTGDSKGSLTFVRLGPRIGYAGWMKQDFGYWLRGGPSALFAFLNSETKDSAGNTDSSSSDAEYFQLSLEAYVVIMAADHVGILVGPHVDIHLFHTGDASDDAVFRSAGLTAGLMGDFF